LLVRSDSSIVHTLLCDMLSMICLPVKATQWAISSYRVPSWSSTTADTTSRRFLLPPLYVRSTEEGRVAPNT
jgi:hypothetical protein